jgi:hypothetical protein
VFRLGVVIARLEARYGQDGGEVCPECALHLAAGPMGRTRPEAFPNLEEFARRLDEWQTPVYASDAKFWKTAGREATGAGYPQGEPRPSSMRRKGHQLR